MTYGNTKRDREHRVMKNDWHYLSANFILTTNLHTTEAHSREKRTWTSSTSHSDVFGSTWKTVQFYLIRTAHKFLNKDSLRWVGAINEMTRLVHPRLTLLKRKPKFLCGERVLEKYRIY